MLNYVDSNQQMNNCCRSLEPSERSTGALEVPELINNSFLASLLEPYLHNTNERKNKFIKKPYKTVYFNINSRTTGNSARQH